MAKLEEPPYMDVPNILFTYAGSRPHQRRVWAAGDFCVLADSRAVHACRVQLMDVLINGSTVIAIEETKVTQREEEDGEAPWQKTFATAGVKQ